MLAALLVPQGADWPAQLFRVELFRQEGFELWNGQWYSGHPTAGYSLLFPPLGSLVGITTLGILSVVAATALFHRIAAQVVGAHARFASIVFGLALVSNIVVGRITFGLGLAIGLGAVFAVQRRRWLLGALLAVATPLASPVAGAFLVLALGAWALHEAVAERRDRALRLGAVAVLALVPIAVTGLIFSSGGPFGFPVVWILAVVVASVVVAALAARAGFRVLAIGAALYLALALAVFIVPNPLGGNIWRLAMFFAVPVALLLVPRGRAAMVGFGAVALIWAWTPAAISVAQVHDDPSVDRAFHAPLIERIQQADPPRGRVEIPFTENHWEAFYVAAELPIARGWERQADRALNPLFYEPTLAPGAYRAWLDRNAVRWVAVPKVALDEWGKAEADLIATDPEWLMPVWSNENWRLYQVLGAAPMASAPATSIVHTPAEISFTMPRRGATAVRVNYSPLWSVTMGDACVARAADGTTLVIAREPGRIALGQDLNAGSGC